MRRPLPPRTSREPTVSRRSALLALFGVGIVAAAPSLGCAGHDASTPAGPRALPREDPGTDGPTREPYADNVDALLDVLVPAELDATGNVTSPGAREVHADRVLDIDAFVPLAIAAGLLPALPERVVASFAGGGAAARASLNADLDLLAALERPLTAFRDLPRDLQARVVRGALADGAHRPALLVVRAAALAAWLGALYSDLGLREIGFPAYESFDDGLAVSGYPRTRSGRLVDATKEDLAALAASGELDDYTYNRAPEPTPADDVSAVLDANGDLL